MDITANSEINEYSSRNENLDTCNVEPDNTENQEKNLEDFHNLSDISVSSADTYTPKTLYNTKYMMPIEITNWEPCFIDDKLVISGIVAGSVQTDRVCKHRLSSLIFKDDDGVTCCISGPMKAENEVPDVIRNHFKYIYRIEKTGEKIFKDGIPDNWLNLCKIWKCYTDTVNKNVFDWPVHLKTFSLHEPVNQTARHTGKTLNNGPKTKIKKKFEKYKSMLELEILRDSLIAESESETHIQIRKKSKKKTVINGFCHSNNNCLETDIPSPLNKRTTCYINNQIPTEPNRASKSSVSCQTDLTLDIFAENTQNDSERNDKNQSTNVTILSPTKQINRLRNSLNNQFNKNTKNQSNKNIILKNLNNQLLESNDDSSSLEFYDNIVANSTVVGGTQATCKKIHYICAKTLEKFANRTSLNSPEIVVEHSDVIDIDLFSQTVLISSQTGNTSNSVLNETSKNISDADPKEMKTIKNNLEKNTYYLRSPKRYIVKTPDETVENVEIVESVKIAETVETVENVKNVETVEKTNKTVEKTNKTVETSTNKTIESIKSIKTMNESSLKRKKSPELSDEKVAKKLAPYTDTPLRVSLRKRKKFNYRELLFNRITLPENSIIDAKIRQHQTKKIPKKQIKQDEKLFKKCFVRLVRENLEPLKTNAISTSSFSVTNLQHVEKENVYSANAPIIQNKTEHVFKTPLTTIIKKNKNILNSAPLPPKLNKTLGNIPNGMPRIKKDRKSLPANPLEMWKIIKSKTRFEKPLPPSPFSILSDTSSDSSDKKRRKLFSPDNWMQSDGCLKSLAQNQYHSSGEGRFSIRFDDDADQNIDSEFSDSSTLIYN